MFVGLLSRGDFGGRLRFFTAPNLKSFAAIQVITPKNTTVEDTTLTSGNVQNFLAFGNWF